MKIIIYSRALCTLASLVLTSTAVCNTICTTSPYMISFSSGYVFKRDRTFNQVYGPGAGNIITVDFSYSRCQKWGIGTKISYWLASGHTTFFKHHTIMHEIPITFYLQKIHTFKHGLRLYASIGGGFIWIGEQSYLGKLHQVRGIGEAESGFNYPLSNCCTFTSAFRYLFPRQKQGTLKVDVGGLDLRGGIALSF